MLANLYFSDNQKPAGLEELELAAHENPTDPEPHLIFGDIALMERRLSDAETQYRAGGELLKTFPDDRPRKTALVSQQQIGLAAVAKAPQAMARSGSDPPRTAHAAAEKRLSPSAACRSAVQFGSHRRRSRGTDGRQQVDASLPPATLTLAGLYRDAGNRDAALKYLRTAVAEAPKDIRPKLALGGWFFDSGDLNGATEQFLDAEQIDPKATEVRFWRGLRPVSRNSSTRRSAISEN